MDAPPSLGHSDLSERGARRRATVWVVVAIVGALVLLLSAVTGHHGFPVPVALVLVGSAARTRRRLLQHGRSASPRAGA